MIMKKENEAVGSLWFELEEVDRVDVMPDEEGPYSITAAYGSLYTLLCC